MSGSRETSRTVVSATCSRYSFLSVPTLFWAARIPKPRRKPHVTTRRPTTVVMMATRKEINPSLCREASVTVAGAAMLELCLRLHLDATVPDGLAERLPVPLVLVGVGHREVREGLVESLRLSEIAGDHSRRAGARMRPGQGPATRFRVLPHGERGEELGQRLELHVAELPYVEVGALGPDSPAQKEIAGRLHEALTDHYPLAAVGVGRGAHVRLEHRTTRLLHLQEEGIIVARCEEGDPASRSHATHADHLGREVHEPVAVEQDAAVLGQSCAVGGYGLLEGRAEAGWEVRPVIDERWIVPDHRAPAIVGDHLGIVVLDHVALHGLGDALAKAPARLRIPEVVDDLVQV